MNMKKIAAWAAALVMCATAAFAAKPLEGKKLKMAISLKTCVERRVTKGAPSPESMREAIARYRAMLAEEDAP